MPTIADRIYTRAKRALAGVGFVIRVDQSSDLATDPSLSAGAAAPTGSEPNGSQYNRTNGSPYWRKGSVWYAMIDLALQRYENGLAARSKLADTVTDLGVLRTQLAAGIVDLGVLRTPVVAALVDLQATLTRYENSGVDWPNIANGTTNGRLKTTAPCGFRVLGALYNKASTDDLWNLSAEAALSGGQYRAYWLYLDSAGTASFAAGTVQASSAAAIGTLPAVVTSKSVIGVYVAGPNTNFANALAAQGTITNGWPAVYTMTAAAPAALTSAAPAAMLTSTTLGIANGTTNGRLKTTADTEYRIAGKVYRKAATDDLWNLSAETATSGAQYRAYWLYLDSSGTASIGAGSNAASAAAALAALPAVTTTKAVIGCYVAGPSTNFANALAAQGTIHDGWPVTAF